MQTNYTDWEFRILEGTCSEIQRWLNQWRHTYELIIHEMNSCNDDESIEEVRILISRRKLS